MMTNQEVLSTYETMQTLTGRMVTAASNADWDAFEALEQQVSAHVEALKANEAKVVLESAGRQRKVALIKQILEDDRKIRDLTMPWMAHLSKLARSPWSISCMAREMDLPFSGMLPAFMCICALSTATRAPSYSMAISLCGEAAPMPVSRPTLA